MEYVLETFEKVSKTSWKRVTKNRLTRWYVLKRSWRHLCKTSWRCLENILARRLEDVLKTFSQDVLKMTWRRLENVLKTSWKRMTKTNILILIKTSSEDVWVRWIYSSWSRRLKDVFRTRRRKMSPRRLHQDECLQGCIE